MMRDYDVRMMMRDDDDVRMMMCDYYYDV